MADEIERLLVRVEANAAQFETQMKKVNRALYGSAAETRKSLDRIKRDFNQAGREVGQSFQPMQAGAQIAFAAISAYSIKAAADAAEVKNAFNVAFGEGADDAREFADVLSERVGRSTTQVQQQMTQLRLVLDGLGISGERADEVVRALSTRAIDIGSLFNVEDADAFRAIISGISGETEPMKRFGVVVNQAAVEAELLRMGFKGTATEATEAQKAMARANVIIQRTAVANGDAANTAESAANQFKRARGEFYEAAIVLGTQLLPAVTKVTKATTDAVQAFSHMPAGVQVAGLAMLGLAAASGPIAAVITALARVVTWGQKARAALIGVTGAGVAAGAGGAGAGAAGLAGLAGPALAIGGTLALSGDSSRPDIDASIATAQRDLSRARTDRERASAQRQLDYFYAARARMNADLEGRAAAEAIAQGPSSGGGDPLAGMNLFTLDGLGGGTGGGSGGAGGRRSSGPSEDDIARLRDELDLRNRIAVAQASGGQAAIRALTEEQRLAELTAAFTEARYDDAAGRALEQVARENEAALAAEEAVKAADQIAAAMEREALANTQARNVAADRLDYEIELARLVGDGVRLEALERQRWINERINELMSDQIGLTREAAEAQADREARAQDGAMGQARFRDLIVSAGTDFGSLVESAGERFKRRALEGLADGLWSAISGAFNAANGDSGGIGGFLRSLIPGFATGTSSAPGGLAYVHKGEVLTNLNKGTSVIPAHAVRAMGALSGGVSSPVAGRSLVQNFHVNAQGAVMAEGLVQELKAVSAQQAAEAGMVSAGYAKADTLKDLTRRQSYSPR